MFVDVILPLALPMNILSYSVPSDLKNEIIIGGRVVVQLKNRRIYSALVCKTHENKPDFDTKSIISVLDKSPIVNEKQLQFWNWLAQYYMCTIGEVSFSALPKGLRLQSETQISLADIDIADIELSQQELHLYEIIEKHKTIAVEKLIDICGRKNIISTLQSMFEKGAISIDENLKTTYKPKLETFVKLCSKIKSTNDLNEILESLKKAKAQEKLLLEYISFCDDFDFENPHKIPKNLLLKKSKSTSAVLNACIKKQIFETEIVETNRIAQENINTVNASGLSDAQESAYNEINKNFETKNTVLLHGVTSSGKTEIYIKLIETQLNRGKQVLYLLPEIALTAQLVARLQKVFGNKVGVYHSKYTEAERVEVYKSLLGNEISQQRYQIIVGARSALFLPYKDLGLIIVDEEHETSYKQSSPAPRYNARDAAIKLAQIHNAKTLLGTATPSLESYFNAKNEKYALVKLAERFGNVCLPEFQTVNILSAYRKKEMNGHFTKRLLDAIYTALQRNEQIILFQNRRGFAPYVQCNDCGKIPHCKYCNVTLTYYKHNNSLRCHYCGYSTTMFNKCDDCGSENITTKGFGTEKIEDELKIIFPNARVARFDLDTTRTRNSYKRIISDFENRDIDILVGTQMVSKGLDFENVSVVGILNADNMLNFPDFRAHERAFQLMTQVGGRAGRRKNKGLVLVQTFNPETKTVRNIIDNDYENLFDRLISERREFAYPPFVRLINISIKHHDINTTTLAAAQLAKIMRGFFGAAVLGPESPAINKIQNKFICVIMLKIDKSKSITQAKNVLEQCFEQLQTQKQFKNITVQVDVDP